MTVRIAAALEKRKREGRENRIRVVVAYGECSRKLGRPATLREVAAVVKLSHKSVWRHLAAALPNRAEQTNSKATVEANRLRVSAAYEDLAAHGESVTAGEVAMACGLGLSTVRKILPAIRRGLAPQAAAAELCRRRVAEALEQLTVDGKPPTPTAVARAAGVERRTAIKHLAAMQSVTSRGDVLCLGVDDHDEIQRRIAAVRNWKIANPSTGGIDGRVLSQILPD